MNKTTASKKKFRLTLACSLSKLLEIGKIIVCVQRAAHISFLFFFFLKSNLKNCYYYWQLHLPGNDLIEVFNFLRVSI